MLDIHITEFYNDVGRIFSKLYGTFPRQVTLWVEDISGSDTPDEYGLHSERYQACYATFLWLADEGYIRFGDVEKQDAFNHCCLTQRGYSLLAGIVFDEGGHYRPIEHIRTALKDKSSSALESAVTDIIHQAIKKRH